MLRLHETPWFLCAAILFAIAILAAVKLERSSAVATPIAPIPSANQLSNQVSDADYLGALANVGTKKRPTEADYARGFLKRVKALSRADPIVEAAEPSVFYDW